MHKSYLFSPQFNRMNVCNSVICNVGSTNIFCRFSICFFFVLPPFNFTANALKIANNDKLWIERNSVKSPVHCRRMKCIKSMRRDQPTRVNNKKLNVSSFFESIIVILGNFSHLFVKNWKAQKLFVFHIWATDRAPYHATQKK